MSLPIHQASLPLKAGAPTRILPTTVGLALGRFHPRPEDGGKTGRGKAETQAAPQYGVLRVTSAFNNTFAALTDVWGTTLTQKSVGSLGIRHRQRLPGAAFTLIADMVEVAAEKGVTQLALVTQGPGRSHSACLAAYRAGLSRSDGKVRSVGARQVLLVPHNGCRAPTKRRKRRKTSAMTGR